VEIAGLEGDITFDSTWVNGDLTTRAQLDGLESTGATATYRGDAVGTVNHGGDIYTATGDLKMVWDFGQRSGWIGIKNFDDNNEAVNGGHGIDVGGHVISFDGQSAFGGTLHGWHANGIVQGGFVNNGDDVAAGVIGNFGFTKGYNYSASGVFMGDKLTPAPGAP